MAIPSARLIHDQNLDIHYTGGAPLGGKTDASKGQKKGGIGGRKALNDISNSGKPSALQASKKHNSTNVISIGKDLRASQTPFSVGGKSNLAKTAEKGQAVSGRRALTDLTNTKKPFVQQVSKNSQDKKLSAITEENMHSAVKEERFLHNHQECIKAQRKFMDKECFLKAVGLSHESSPFVAFPPSSKLRVGMVSQPISPAKHLEMEEMPVELIEEDRVLKHDWKDFLGYLSPACGSPISAKPSSRSWKEDNFPDFTLAETPKPPGR